MNLAPLAILYGTETGNARDVSYDLQREAYRRGVLSRVCDLANFDVKQLPLLPVAVFVVSTTGQGDVPGSMKAFWRFLLRKSLPSNSLSSMHFAVFGLGDSGYQKFNLVAKMLYNRLVQLGGTPLVRRGDGDDQHNFGYYGDFFPWQEELLRRYTTLYPPSSIASPLHRDIPSAYSVKVLLPNELSPLQSLPTAEREDVQNRSTASAIPPSYHTFTLKSNHLLTSEDAPFEVRHFVLSIPPDSSLTYQPGDILSILPQNPPAAVDFVLSTLSLDPHQVLQISQLDNERALHRINSSSISMRELFTYHLDFLGFPRRVFLELLSNFTTDELHKHKLQFLSSREGSGEYFEYCVRSRRSCLDILIDFQSAKPPISALLDLFPPIQPRQFSISSAQSLHPDEVQVTVLVVSYETNVGRKKQGLCTHFLARSVIPKNIFAKFAPGTLRPPPPSIPLILIGPGTGCAAPRSFLQDRAAIIKSGGNVSPSLFYFGCRHSERDNLYAEEWAEYVRLGVLEKVVTAFSRDQESKIYVQHKLRHDFDLLWSYLERGAVVIVSGRSGAMPREVRRAFVYSVAKGRECTDDEAEAYINSLETQGRYLTETWK